MTKRICAMLLALTMACTTAVGVYAETAVTADNENTATIESYEDESDENDEGEPDESYFDGDWEYDFTDDGTVQILAYRGSDAEVTVPSVISGKKVTIIDGAFMWDESLKSVTLPDSITYIGMSTFKGCTNLESINIPDSVTYIDESAFEDCTNLESINIPDSVVRIGQCAFLNTAILSNQTTEIKYIDKWAVYCDTDKDSLEIKSDTVGIADYLFDYHEDLTSIKLPDSLKYIGAYVFYDCENLKSVTMSNSVVNIGYGAFLNCIALKSMKIPKSVKTIGEYAVGYNYDVNAGEKYVLESFIMKCYSGSAAAKYAKENKVNYLIIDKKPSTPTIKKASKSKTSVRLYFKSVAGISGYKVQQYNTKKKKWVTVGLSKVNYAKSKGYNYKITGLKKGTKYKFRVQAYTKLSSKTLKSGWSKTFTVTTKK